MTLSTRTDRSGVQLAARAELADVTTVDGIGVCLRRRPAPRRILVDGYHSWDWAGVRDATREGRGWWGAIWGDPAAGAAAALVVRLATTPVAAVRLAWDGPGVLDVFSCAEPVQLDDRTGLPGTLTPGSRRAIASDAITLAAAGAAPPAPPPPAPPRVFGWMSWNCLGAAVSADAVREAARALVPQGGTVLVDDGWMRCWGDWEERDGFRGTLATLAAELGSGGQRLGVWLAPFLADPRSLLVAEHPELLLRNGAGHPVVDRRPVQPMLVLDGALEAVRDHLGRLGERLGRADVAAVKLDFLYAGALPGEHAGGRSGTVALRNGLEALVSAFRTHAPAGAAVLACGSPLPPIVGLADACRCGGDSVINVPNAGAEPPHPWFIHGPGLVRAQTRNLAARAWLWDAAVQRDVDAVTLGVVGDTPQAGDPDLDTWLLLARRSGGPFLVSDLPTGLSAARRERLRAEFGAVTRGIRAWRPRDPLEMVPAPMTDDDFYAWPATLPGEWEPIG